MKGRKMPLEQIQPAACAEQEEFTLQDLLEQYMEVSRCWADPTLAVKTSMTVEVAISTLLRVQMKAPLIAGGSRLTRMATDLMWEIVRCQQDDPSLEEAMRMDERGRLHPIK